MISCNICGQNVESDEGDHYPVIGHPNVEEFICYACIKELEKND